jgi:diketogulonate reductase-like aldo/keto reductase
VETAYVSITLTTCGGIMENCGIFDFELSAVDMKKIAALDTNTNVYF